MKVYQRGEGHQAGSVGALLELTGHGGAITDVTFPLPEEPYLVTSSSQDGTVRLWDCRAAEGSREVQRYTASFAKSYASATLGGGNDHLVCGAWNEQILFWDRRAGTGLQVFEDSHSEEVTRVRFQPGRRQRLFTASVDGLACAFDLGGCPADINDEDGLLAVMTTDTAISEMGFCARPGGGSGESDVLWVLTGNEEMWVYDAGANAETFGDQLAHVPHTREAARRAAHAAGHVPKPVPPPPGHEPEPGEEPEMDGLAHRVDYLIGCYASPGAEAVYVAAGTQAGTVGVFPLVSSDGLGAPVAVLEGGHKDIVRAMAWSPGAAQGPVTGAEDSRVCVWGAPGDATDGRAGRGGTAAGGKASLGATRGERRHSPY